MKPRGGDFGLIRSRLVRAAGAGYFGAGAMSPPVQMLHFSRNFARAFALPLVFSLAPLALSACGDDVDAVTGGTLTGGSSGGIGSNAAGKNSGGTQNTGDATGAVTTATGKTQTQTAGTGTSPDAKNKSCVGVDPEGPADPNDNKNKGSTTTSMNTGASGSTPSNSTASDSTGSSSTGSSSTASTDTQSDSSGTDPNACKTPACIGDMGPLWELHDYQPLSCGYGKDYGFADFIGKPVMVVFLAGWCPYCRGQAEALEKMRLELSQAGHRFNVAIINMASANTVAYRKMLLDRTMIPLFQDNDFADLETRHSANKDDMFIYDSRGILQDTFLHGKDSRPSNLSTPEGFNAVKEAFLKVINAS